MKRFLAIVVLILTDSTG